MFKIYRTEEFEKLMNKLLTNEEKIRAKRIEEEISKVSVTGKPLGFKFLREKKISEKRVYFLVYEDLQAVLMVSIGDKKTQQETIDKIKEFLPEFRRLMEKTIKVT